MEKSATDPYLAQIDPQLRDGLALVPVVDYAAQFAERRGPLVSSRGAWQPDVPVAEVQVPAFGDGPAVTVLVINQCDDGRVRPIVLFLHGGGFIGGSVHRDVVRMQDTARIHDCIVISVDYRLAPETPFPGARDDCYAALRWAHANAAAIGGDASRITLLGESAGGGLAAQVALLARDLGQIPIVGQVLSYPMLDDRTGTTSPVPAHIGTHVWTPVSNHFGWKSYLGAEPGGPDVSPRAAPAREPDLSGLPQAWIGVGSLDLFVGESIGYAERLIAAAVPTGLLVLPGAYHGFNRLVPEAEVSNLFNSSVHAALEQFMKTEK
jgi:acetyl esterase/lipase